jgi:hypothetical protein
MAAPASPPYLLLRKHDKAVVVFVFGVFGGDIVCACGRIVNNYLFTDSSCFQIYSYLIRI